MRVKRKACRSGSVVDFSSKSFGWSTTAATLDVRRSEDDPFERTKALWPTKPCNIGVRKML